MMKQQQITLFENEQKLFDFLIARCHKICVPENLDYRLFRSIIAICEIDGMTPDLMKLFPNPNYACGNLLRLIKKGLVREHGDLMFSFIPKGYWYYKDHGGELIEFVKTKS